MPYPSEYPIYYPQGIASVAAQRKAAGIDAAEIERRRVESLKKIF